MEEDTKYIGVRVPVSLYHKLKKIAHEKQTTLTEIAIESFNQYTSNTIPGLCPECHTQNNPDSQYCQKCGNPLTTDQVGKSNLLNQYNAEKEVILKDIDRILDVLEPYKPIAELSKEFSKEDLFILSQLGKLVLKNKTAAKDIISEIKNKQELEQKKSE